MIYYILFYECVSGLKRQKHTSLEARSMQSAGIDLGLNQNESKNETDDTEADAIVINQRRLL